MTHSESRLCGCPILGEERFESLQQSAHSQAVGQLDAAVHGGARQAKQLGDGLAELLHAVYHLPTLLPSTAVVTAHQSQHISTAHSAAAYA